jgi:hypothetical protein
VVVVKCAGNRLGRVCPWRGASLHPSERERLGLRLKHVYDSAGQDELAIETLPLFGSRGDDIEYRRDLRRKSKALREAAMTRALVLASPLTLLVQWPDANGSPAQRRGDRRIGGWGGTIRGLPVRATASWTGSAVASPQTEVASGHSINAREQHHKPERPENILGHRFLPNRPLSKPRRWLYALSREFGSWPSAPPSC